MNTSFDTLHLVNTYGAFGAVGKVRNEIVLEGTMDHVPTRQSEWRAYEFKAKPTDPARAPVWISPYHHRLDWLIWFAAMSNYQQHPWVVHFSWKLLHNDPVALSLIARNPFPDRPPRYIRAELYRYRFTKPGDGSGAYWTRERVGEWFPPLSTSNPSVREFMRMHRWL